VSVRHFEEVATSVVAPYVRIDVMDRKRFEELVSQAIDSLPEEFLDVLNNIDIVVEDEPTREQLSELHHGDLLGLYEGVPLTERGSGYALVLPDKISIFQKPIESKCRTEADIAREIRSTIQHEIAHHFGISDERLDKLGR